MARSHGVLKVELWQPGSDFRDLEMPVQWTYMMLLSQPQINNLGILPYTPERWARLTQNVDTAACADLVLLLARANYVLVDLDTGELCVRTFIYHDKVWAQPALVKNARLLIGQVESDEIRHYLQHRHPWLVETVWMEDAPDYTHATKHVRNDTACLCSACWDKASIERHETPFDTPLKTPFDTPLPDPSREGSSPRARTSHTHAGAGAGVGLSTSALEGSPAPAAAHAAAAQVEEHLKALKLNGRVKTLALAEPDRALAWINLAHREANSNPAGYVRTGITSGDWPSPRLDTTITNPIDQRRHYVETTGWRLELDQLAHILTDLGADDTERLEHLDHAADLQAGRVTP